MNIGGCWLVSDLIQRNDKRVIYLKVCEEKEKPVFTSERSISNIVLGLTMSDSNNKCCDEMSFAKYDKFGPLF